MGLAVSVREVAHMEDKVHRLLPLLLEHGAGSGLGPVGGGKKEGKRRDRG